MRLLNVRGAFRKVCVLVSASATCSLIIAAAIPSATENAAANGDTRTIHFFHTHTGETIDATYRVDGRYDENVLRQLNHFLRDWRNNDEIAMDPRLFDAVWEAYRSAGATDRIQIYSAYRSPETNAMLRRRSRAVAEHSQHMLGKAMDTTLPGFPMDRVRDAGMKLQRGGVGWYPSANFVHLDVGGVRSWPRMPYEQLARLFPDGKTVHIPSNGQPMPGYEQARLELASRGATDLPPAQESGGFFAWLFGGNSNNTVGAAREDEEDRRTAVAAASPPQRQPEPQPVVQAAPAQATAPDPQSAALAYAEAPTAPVLETHRRNEQVASLEQTKADNTAPLDLEAPSSLAASSSVMPMPPRRPSEFAMAALEIPLPPVRPDALARMQSASIRFAAVPSVTPAVDPIGGLITATASGVPMIRKSRLPALITQGDTHRTLPHHAMSFAETESIVDPEVVPARIRPLSLRSAARAAASSGSGPMTQPMIAPKLTGLRRAARAMAERASL